MWTDAFSWGAATIISVAYSSYNSTKYLQTAI